MLDRVEARFAGTFGTPAAPFRLTLEGATRELRKLAAMSPAIQELLPLAAQQADDALGSIVTVERWTQTR